MPLEIQRLKEDKVYKETFWLFFKLFSMKPVQYFYVALCSLVPLA